MRSRDSDSVTSREHDDEKGAPNDTKASTLNATQGAELPEHSDKGTCQATALVASYSVQEDGKGENGKHLRHAIVNPLGFRIGQLDNSGACVVRIYVQRPDYVVYRTDDAIHIEYDHGLDDIDRYYDLNAKLLRHTSRVTSLLPTKLNSCEPMCSQVARAVVTNLRGFTDEAINMLAEAEVRIRKAKLIQARLLYSASSLAMTVLVLLACYSRFIYDREVVSQVSYWDIVSCGAMGGFLSVVIGFPKLVIDIDADNATNCLIGGSRILIAMVAAVFAFFLVKSGFALRPLDTPTSPFGMYALAMAAGFSESFVPNILDNLTSSSRRGEE